MNSIELVNVASRWIHIMTAIVVVGGTCFVRFVLLPAAEKLSAAEHDQLRGFIMRTWRKFVHGGIVLFLASGLYNYLAVAVPSHRGDRVYHALMGVKITLAFVVFFLASVLVGRSAAFETLRRDGKKWLLVLIGLAAVIVLISSFLKVTRPGHPAEPQPAHVSAN